MDEGQMIYFYPHRYLRDRQLDTVRTWRQADVLNADDFKSRGGAQVARRDAMAGKVTMTWKQKLPLLNVKIRPRHLRRDDVVYVWGAVLLSGRFITDIDNPYSLVGYNLKAMPMWAPVIRAILLSNRCLEIRCMSEACKQTLALLFGPEVALKAHVHYPRMRQQVASLAAKPAHAPHFLFVGTQFDIKGGASLLRVWERVHRRFPDARLDVITHLPVRHQALAARSGAQIHAAAFGRHEIWTRFMQCADVLILPTFVESFGMVALEALAHGLALIATDVYALSELVQSDVNGCLLSPPISVWDGYLPSRWHYMLDQIPAGIDGTDTTEFEAALERAIVRLCEDPALLERMKAGSIKLFADKFRADQSAPVVHQM